MKLKTFFLIILSTAGLMGCSKVGVSDISSSPSSSDEGQTVDEGGVHNTSFVLKMQSADVDLLLVIDDSASMYPENLALGGKMEGFIRKLESYSLDWQMCMTTTDVAAYKGDSIPWTVDSRAENWILKKGDSNLSETILDTIARYSNGFLSAGDERGIASMSRHLDKAVNNHCYRPGAALSVILISDEDERSSGGIPGSTPLEDIDLPENYINKVQTLLGSKSAPVPHTVHSIIVPPGDQSCLEEQYRQGNPGSIGTIYHTLSALTGGSVASICSRDYSQNLNVFADHIQKSLQRVKLDCAPAAGWKVSTVPAIQNIQTHAEGDFLVIGSQVTQDTVVNVQYKCQ